MDTALIVVSIISVIGGIVTIQLIQYNYYKKQDYSYNINKQKKFDTLQFSQMRKELGLNKKAVKEEPTEKNMFELLQGLDLDKVKGLIGAVQEPEVDLEPQDKSVIDIISDVVQDNPEIVQGFLQKMNQNDNQDKPIVR